MLISIVYDSGFGHTAKLAQSVAEGIHEVPGVEARLIAVGQGTNPFNDIETISPRPMLFIMGEHAFTGVQ